MLKIRRICIPLGLDCNLHCKYCYRDMEKLPEIPDFSPEMIGYLNNLTPDWCEAVIASGGEPLMYWNKVLELFSYVPENIHRRIMTNGIFLTQDKIDYINEHNIKLHVSHDGKQTKFLRGVDILDDPKIVNLLRQVKTMRVYGVCTKYNPDVWENMFDTLKRLGREDVYYDTFPMSDIPEQADMVEGFNYDLWFKTHMEWRMSSYWHNNPYTKAALLTNDPSDHGRLCGFNVLPNGTICGMAHICSRYGTIFTETYDELRQELIRLGEMDPCLKGNCSIKDRCPYPCQNISAHICKCRRLIIENWTKENLKKIREYVRANLSEIEKKYGYK